MDNEIGDKVLKQVMNLWIIPELEDRKKKGKLNTKFILYKAQVIFYPGRNPKIRINDEVKAVVEAKINRSVKKGDPIYERDLTEVKNIKLNEDVNNSHITLFRFKDQWIIAFDSQNNKKLRREYLEVAKEFYESSLDNFKKDRLRVFYDNAYSSAELCTVSILLFNLNRNMVDNKNHRQWYGIFKKFTDVGNAKEDFPAILKKLNGLRKSARYLAGTLFKKEDHKEIIKILKEMINFAESFLN